LIANVVLDEITDSEYTPEPLGRELNLRLGEQNIEYVVI
jgi:hypothetical protein